MGWLGRRAGGKDEVDRERGEGIDPDVPTPPTGPLSRRVFGLSEAMLRYGVLILVIGLGLGIALGPLVAKDTAYVLENDLQVDQRKKILLTMIATLAVVVVGYAALWLKWRRRDRELGFGDAAVRINRYSVILLGAPLLSGLLHPGIESGQRLLALVLIGVIAGLFLVVCYRVLATTGLGQRGLSPGRGVARWLPAALVVGLGAFYAIYMSHLALVDHRNMGTATYDLGIYNNVFWRTLHGDTLGCSYCKAGEHASAHFDPIIILLAPLYGLAPRADSLLVFQTVWLATAVIPLYLIAVRRLGDAWSGVILVAIYVLYPALHGVNMFDFHSLTLVVPSLVWSIYLLDSGSKWAYAGVLALVLMTREDMSLLACFLGLYAIFIGRVRTGLVTILVAVVYLATIKTMFMNDSGLIMKESQDSTSYAKFYEEMIPHAEEGVRGLVISAVTNPVFVLKLLLKEPKFFFFLALLLPVMFLPLAAGRKTVIMLYGLVFIGFASRKHMFSLHFQYSSVLFPVLLAALPDGVARTSKGRIAAAFATEPHTLVRTLMLTCLCSTALASLKFGVMLPNRSFRAGWNVLDRTPDRTQKDRYRFIEQVAAELPGEASVCNTSGLGPHVSSRQDVALWPACKDSDYLVLNIQGFKTKDDRKLDRMVKDGKYRLVDTGFGIEVFEKVDPSERATAREEGKKLPDTAKRRAGEEARRDTEEAPNPYEDAPDDGQAREGEAKAPETKKDDEPGQKVEDARPSKRAPVDKPKPDKDKSDDDEPAAAADTDGKAPPVKP